VDLQVDDGTDPERAAVVATGADVALVVVGYTRLDEGEFIGEFATSHLTDLFPGEDDPDLVERFTAEIATERTIQPPDHVAAPEGGVGFAVGGDRRSLRLHDHDVALIRSVAAANPRTVVAVVAGSAVVVSEWDSSVPAIVQSWYSGMEGGHGLADVLLGRVDAGGRLPFSVPVDPADLPEFDPDATGFTYDTWHGYWHLARHGTAPAYPFGFGLSYTGFTLESASIALAGDAVRVAATVRNVGPRPGTDVVQVYATRTGSSRPERLVGFSRLGIGTGDAVTAEIGVPISTLAERDTGRHAMVVRPGAYRIRVARDAVDPGITGEIVLG
jgi:beta-glucosidase